MSIRPLDLQVLIPKTSEVAHKKQLENQKHSFEQAINSDELKKQVQAKNEKVIKSKDKEKTNNHHDAKQKSKQTYQAPTKNKQKRKKQQEKENNKSELKIDIRI